MWFSLRLWLTNKSFPSASFSSLCSGCSGHSGVLTFLWLFEPKERIGCSASLSGDHLSLCCLLLAVRLHAAEFCKHAHGLLAHFALISRPTGPPPMPPLLWLNTGDRAWQATNVQPLGFLPISFPEMGDQIIFWFTHITRYFLLNIWNENSIIWCLGFFPSFVWLAVHWEKVYN